MSTESVTGTPAVPDLQVNAAFVPASPPRRVLVYAPLAYSTPHFETDLEIAQRHLDLGDHVELVLCDAELSSCQLNPHGELRRCVQCVSRNLQGRAQLSAAPPTVGLRASLTPCDHARLATLPRAFPDQQSLRRYRFDTFDAGVAVVSSLIDFARATHLDVQQHAALVHRTLEVAVSSYLAFKRILAARPYDRVYIYNGRWSMVRSAVRACEEARVPYYTHERGADFRKFALYRDVLPHDKNDFRIQVAAAWEHAQGHPQTRPLGEAFFQDRRQRVERNWFSFTKGQECGRVPADWGQWPRRVVFFTSSEFEYASIAGEASGRIYRDQLTGAPRIAALLAAAAPDLHLWIRVHPNERGSPTALLWPGAVGHLPNVTLILPEAAIDSYALLEGADRILTFGSTLGIEATYWGKPVVCADTSFYDGLDAQYDAATEAELIELLTRPTLEPKPRDHALRYGYHLNTVGARFAHFDTGAISDFEFKSPFRGRCLKPDYDDLRQRLLALYQEGEVTRAANIARLCAAFNPQDGMAHSILILARLRLGALPDALSALEDAAAKSSAPQLAAILKSTAQPLLDAIRQFANREASGKFQAIAERAGGIMQRVPSFAALGKNLIAVAHREPAPVA